MTATFRHLQIEQALAGLFPSGVAVACEPITAESSGLWPVEAEVVAGAAPSRVCEYAAGRRAARRALLALGLEAVAIPSGKDRAPIWPVGINGSIAHAGGFAIAATRKGGPLGLDVEPETPLDADLCPIVCTDDELAALPSTGRELAAKRIFLAKEAAYKAQYPLTGRLLEFDAIVITLRSTGFVATFHNSAPAIPAGHAVTGRFASLQGMVLAGIAL